MDTNKWIPFNPGDSLRWQDAIFENWSTLGYKVNRGAIADRMIGYSPKFNQVDTQDSDHLAKQKRNRDLGVTRWEVGGWPATGA